MNRKKKILLKSLLISGTVLSFSTVAFVFSCNAKHENTLSYQDLVHYSNHFKNELNVTNIYKESDIKQISIKNIEDLNKITNSNIPYNSQIKFQIIEIKSDIYTGVIHIKYKLIHEKATLNASVDIIGFKNQLEEVSLNKFIDSFSKYVNIKDNSPWKNKQSKELENYVFNIEELNKNVNNLFINDKMINTKLYGAYLLYISSSELEGTIELELSVFNKKNPSNIIKKPIIVNGFKKNNKNDQFKFDLNELTKNVDVSLNSKIDKNNTTVLMLKQSDFNIYYSNEARKWLENHNITPMLELTKNDIVGSISVKIIYKKNDNIFESKTYVFNNFITEKTAVEKELNKETININFKVLNKQILASEVINNNIVILNNSKENNVEILEKKSDDLNGNLTIFFKLTRGKHSSNIANFIIENFKTKDQIDKEFINKLSKKVQIKFVDRNKAEIKASTIKTSDFNVENITDDELKKVTIKRNIIFNDNQGFVEVSFIFTLNNYSFTLKNKVNGFKNPNQNDLNLLQEYIKTFNVTYEGTKNKYSGNVNVLDFKITKSNDPKYNKISHKISYPLDDYDGTISVKIEYKMNNFVEYKIFNFEGFKRRTQAEYYKKFIDYTEIVFPEVLNKNRAATSIKNELNDHEIKLSIPRLYESYFSDFHVETSSSLEIDDEQGQLIVTLYFKNRFTNELIVKKHIISGFKSIQLTLKNELTKLEKLRINTNNITYKVNNNAQKLNFKNSADFYKDKTKFKSTLEFATKNSHIILKIENVNIDKINGNIKISYRWLELIDPEKFELDKNIEIKEIQTNLIVTNFNGFKINKPIDPNINLKQNYVFDTNHAIPMSFNAHLYPKNDANDYIYLGNEYNTNKKQHKWSPQEGAFQGINEIKDFFQIKSNLDEPDFNPNENKFTSAIKQRDDIFRSKGNLNLKWDNYQHNYNFFKNRKEIAARDALIIMKHNFTNPNDGNGSNGDEFSRAPQPLKPPVELLNFADAKHSQLNLDSLKYLLQNNEIGQNAEMFAWKLITLSDEIRNNILSIMSDNIQYKNMTDREKNMYLFLVDETNPNISNVEFFAKKIDNISGVIELVIKYKENNIDVKSSLTLNFDNIELKNDAYFIEYINNRSFQLDWGYLGYIQDDDPDDPDTTWDAYKYANGFERLKNLKPELRENNSYLSEVGSLLGNPPRRGSNKINMIKRWSGGTAWLVDRIIDENEKKSGNYSFIVATNKHVMDIAKYTGVQIYGDDNTYFPGVDSIKVAQAYLELVQENYNEHHPNAKITITSENYNQYLTEKEKLTYLEKVNSVQKIKERNKKTLFRQKYYLRNSGFSYFKWKHFETNDYSTLSPVSTQEINAGSHAIKNIQTKKQLTIDIEAHDVVNLTSHPVKNLDDWMKNKQNVQIEPNFNYKEPTFLIESRKNFAKSLIYTPRFTLGHTIQKNDVQVMPELQPFFKREAQQGNWTSESMGPDMIFMKMTFNIEDLKKSWKWLYNLLMKDNIEEQKQAFYKLVSQESRTDDRVNSYLAGYPSLGSDRVFSYRTPKNSVSFSARDRQFVLSGFGNNTKPVWRPWDQEYWEKHIEKYTQKGNEFDLAINGELKWPYNKIISNPNNGIYERHIMNSTESFMSGDHANPGNSGSMIIDANLINYGIVFAFTEHEKELGKTRVAHFMQQDPYARSTFFKNEKPNFGKDLQRELKRMNINTLVLNPKN